MPALLFDMDGTVIDSEPLWLEAEIEVMKELGFEWNEQDQFNCLGGPMERTENYMQARSGNVKPHGYFAKRLTEVMKYKFEHNLTVMTDALRLIKGAREHGIKTALVTASSRDLMQIAITKFPDDSFDVCISKDDVSRSKPDPEPYLKAAEILKTEIGNTVVLEDSLTGVKSGLASGAQVVGISHSINFEKSLNLRVVSSLKEIDFSDLLKWYPFLDLAR